MCDEIPTCWQHQKGRVSTPGCRSSRRDEQSPHPPLSTPGCGSAVPIHKKKFLFPCFYLFNVEEVLGIEGDGSAWDRNIFIQSPTVTHVGLDSKCYRFGLQTEKHIQKYWQLFIHKNSALIISSRPAELSSLENIYTKLPKHLCRHSNFMIIRHVLQ